MALGFPLADPIVGLLIAVAICYAHGAAARDVFARLLDGVDPTFVATARDVLHARPGVVDARRIRMRWVGHRLEADVELDVDPALSLNDAHRVAHDAEHALAHAIPKLSTVVVHAYPAHGADAQQLKSPADLRRWGGRLQAAEGIDAAARHPHRRLVGVVDAEQARRVGAAPVVAERQRLSSRQLRTDAVAERAGITVGRADVARSCPSKSTQLPFHAARSRPGCGGGSVSFTRQASAPSRWQLVTQFGLGARRGERDARRRAAVAAPSRVAEWNAGARPACLPRSSG